MAVDNKGIKVQQAISVGNQSVGAKDAVVLPWAQEIKAIISALEVAPESGLTSKEVRERQKLYGSNQLREVKARSLLSILWNQLKSIVVALLLAASFVSFYFSEWVQGIAVCTVIVINTAIGFITEWRAVRSMEALRSLGQRHTSVRREGHIQRIAAEELVPGDIVVFEAGDIVTADMRLLEVADLQADESLLTGESVPVRKSVSVLPDKTHMAERSNMLFKGTALTRGSGEAVVTSTGLHTEIGHVAKLVAEAEAKSTPLEKKLAVLARQLVYVTLVITTIIAVSGVLQGRDTVLAIEIAIALAVAAIPEGLPIVATIALATGLHHLAQRNALINRLSAVETLGATSVIITDKTGTLTENRMTLNRIEVSGQRASLSGKGLELQGSLKLETNSEESVEALIDQVLKVGVLCNNASLFIKPDSGVEIVGDPTEVALLVAGAKRNFQRDQLLQDMPELREEPFSSESKAMATYHQDKEGKDIFVAVKGAPETILGMCETLQEAKKQREFTSQDKTEWKNKAEEMAKDGLRVLAFACKNVSNSTQEPYQGLTFLGIVGMQDPPREGVKEAIDHCHAAGIKVVMMTGDHPATAYRIGKTLGILPADSDLSNVQDLRKLARDESFSNVSEIETKKVFARSTPKQKQDLIKAYQDQELVVAMTGDGVNDAPALKSADIGIAMGQRGTQVAKDASAMILLDDAFSSIVAAIKQGRIIYNNIQKFVVYLMSCNLSEILIIGLATFAGTPLPLLPLQILFLNLVTDVFPALALGVSKGSDDILLQAPRSVQAKLLSRRQWTLIFGYGLLISVFVLCAMLVAINVLGYDDKQAVTVSFLTLAFAQLWHVFNLRDNNLQIINNEIMQNRWVWGAIILCTVLVLGAVFTPVVSDVLQLSVLDAKGWTLVMVSSVGIVFTGPILRAVLAKIKL